VPLYLLDTNVLIDLTSEKKTFDFFEDLPKENLVLATSLICVAEFTAGGHIKENQALKGLLQSGELITLAFQELEEAYSAGELKYKMALPLPDSVILATAIQHHAHLLTGDKILFTKAKQYIPVTNPFDYE